MVTIIRLPDRSNKPEHTQQLLKTNFGVRRSENTPPSPNWIGQRASIPCGAGSSPAGGASLFRMNKTGYSFSVFGNIADVHTARLIHQKLSFNHTSSVMANGRFAAFDLLRTSPSRLRIATFETQRKAATLDNANSLVSEHSWDKPQYVLGTGRGPLCA